MARIRSIHPGQASDADFVECSMPARLLAILLRNFSDDNGVFAWKPKQIKMDCFPADSIEIESLLDELVTNHQVQKYEKSGNWYGIFRNFRRWQRPEKPKTTHPIDDSLLNYAGLSPTGSRQSPTSDGEATKTDSDVTGTVSGMEGNESEAARARGFELETLLREAAGWQNEPHPNLAVTGQIEALIAAGADMDLDVLPTVRALAPRANGRSNWKYFVKAIAQARDDRIAASKIVSPNGGFHGKRTGNQNRITTSESLAATFGRGHDEGDPLAGDIGPGDGTHKADRAGRL